MILSEDYDWLRNISPEIKKFLRENLKLELNFDKVFITTIASGIDFLGWVNFADHRILRTSTKRRMLKKIRTDINTATINSYLGLLSHGNSYKLKGKIFHFI